MNFWCNKSDQETSLIINDHLHKFEFLFQDLIKSILKDFNIENIISSALRHRCFLETYAPQTTESGCYVKHIHARTNLVQYYNN